MIFDGIEWNVNINIEGEQKALNTRDKLNAQERELKESFDQTNQQIRANSQQIQRLNNKLGSLQKAKNEAFDPQKIKHFENEIKATKEQIESLGGKALPKVNEEAKKLQQLGQGIGKAFALGIVANEALKVAKNIAAMTEEITTFNRELNQTTGAKGKELDTLSAKIRGLAKTLNKDQRELTTTVNAMAKNFGSSQAEALDLVSKGFVKGADIKGDYLKRLDEYSVQFKNAGLTAKQAIQVAIQSIRGGGYDDKLEDTIKEAANLRLGEQTKAVKDALGILGKKFSEGILKAVDKKEITKIDAFKKILLRAKELNLSASQTQKLVADMGGGALEDIGGLEVVLKNLTAAQNIQLEANTEYEKQLVKRIELDTKLAATQGEIAKELVNFATSTTELYKEVQNLIYQGLLEFIKSLKAIPSFLEENKEGLIYLATAIALFNSKLIANRIATIATTTATKAHTLATRASAFATNLLAKATNFLKVAMKTNPFGLIAGAVMAAVAAYSLFTKKTGELKEAGNEATKTLRKENVEFNLQIERLKKLKKGSKERKDLIDKINKKYKEYLPNLLTEKSSIEDINKAQKAANNTFKQRINLMSLEAQQKLVIDKLAEAKLESKARAKALAERSKSNIANQLIKSISGQTMADMRAIESSRNKIKDYNETLERLHKEQTKIIAQIEKESNKKSTKKEEKKKGKGTDTAAVEAAKKKALELQKLEQQAFNELEKLRKQREIAANKEAQKNEKKHEVKKALIQREALLTTQLAEIEQKQALSIAKTKSQEALARERFAAKKIEIQTNLKEKLKAVNLAIMQDGKKAAANFRAMERNSKKLGDIDTDNKEFNEIIALQESYKKDLITYEQYEKRKAEIEFKYARERYENELLFLENKLSVEGLHIAKKANIQQQIIDLKKSFADKELEIEKRKNESIIAEETKKKERIAAIKQAGYEAGLQLINLSFEKDNQRNQEALEKLEKNKQKEIESAGDNSQRKEQIEKDYAKKIAQVKLKQAKLERERALFDIFVNTSAASIKTASNMGLPAALPLMGLMLFKGGLEAAAVKKAKLPSYYYGTNKLKRKNGEPQGRDTILIRANEGEGIVPTNINTQLLKTGIGATNPRLPQLVKLGLAIENGEKAKAQNTIINNKIDAVEIAQEIAKILPPSYQLQVDQNGFNLFRKAQNETTKILNKDNQW